MLATARGLFAQSCPSNIGFEGGDFSIWQCYASRQDTTGTVPINWGDPIRNGAPTQHTLIKNKSPQDLDPYGRFPVNSPNGSNYTLMLGNAQVAGAHGGYCERITYELEVPNDDYTLVYYYAVVFQNPKDHDDNQQPKFIANVNNLDDPSDHPCGSFSFTAGAGLRGFESVQLGKETIYYKPWSPITIRIQGRKGKRFQLEFINRDCALGGHFGYTYLDFNENCASPITGNNYCAGTTTGAVLTAPSGFDQYLWTNSKGDTVGRTPTLKLNPAPPDGTVYSLQIIPYSGLGCQNTFTTTIQKVNGPFKLSVQGSIGGCLATGVNLKDPAITQGSSPGLKYEYYTDADGQNFLSDPSMVTVPGDYYIRGSNAGGCTDIGKIHVDLQDGPVLEQITPSPVCEPQKVDLTAAAKSPQAGVVFDYFLDASLTSPILNPKAINETGYYYIRGTSAAFPCTTVRSVYVVVAPLISATDKVLKGCPPLNLYSALTNSTDNGGRAVYNFYTDATLTKPITDPTIITQSGTYYYNAQNSYGCVGNTAKIEVTVYPIPYFTVQQPDNVVYPRTVNLIFTHPPLTYADFTYWRDAELTIPLTNYQNIGESGTYYIKAVSFGGCIQSHPVTVIIKPPPEPDLIAPTAFTPNGDGINDEFRPRTTGIIKLNYFKIFNRYGKEVFLTGDIYKRWNGAAKGKPEPVGTYYWIFSAEDLYRKKEYTKTGMITLLR